MGEIVLQNVTKEFTGGVRAVDGVDMTIADGEFMVLVGPSGCGKTTLLRSIGGLETITEGKIVIDGRDVTKAAPAERDLAMVFQNYALYPHMTVRQNLGYALRVRKTPKKEINQRVEEAAKLLGLDGLLDRRPGALSGGQMQRVAMGRAIVREPKAFLMDEPLSNLDAKLRVSMRAQLSSLHARLGTTTIYVTHDQVEAMTLGQRVAVMRDGKILQIDTPQALYNTPVNLYVAAFIGSPAMNLVEATIAGGSVEFGGFRIPLAAGHHLEGAPSRLIVGIRPEAFEDATVVDSALPRIEVTTDVVEDLGPDTHLIFQVDAPPVDVTEVREAAGDEDALLQADRAVFTARVDPQTSARPGRAVQLSVDPAKFHYFDPATGSRLAHAAATAELAPV
jgi:multiple sugar transport system ATP-binding protein